MRGDEAKRGVLYSRRLPAGARVEGVIYLLYRTARSARTHTNNRIAIGPIPRYKHSHTQSRATASMRDPSPFKLLHAAHIDNTPSRWPGPSPPLARFHAPLFLARQPLSARTTPYPCRLSPKQSTTASVSCATDGPPLLRARRRGPPAARRTRPSRRRGGCRCSHCRRWGCQCPRTRRSPSSA